MRQQVEIGEAPHCQEQPVEEGFDERRVGGALRRCVSIQPFARTQPRVEAVQRLARAFPRCRGRDDDRHFDTAAAPPREDGVDQRCVAFFLVGNRRAFEEPARQFDHRTDTRRHDDIARRIVVLHSAPPE